MDNYKIYKLVSPSGKIYIGQTKQKFEKRLTSHKYNSNHKTKDSNLPIYNAIRKYGWDKFEKEIILDKIAEDKIDDLERQYIKELNTLAPNGYNLDSGGNKNKNLSESTKEKLRQLNLGRKRTLESRLKQSKSSKGRKLSKETIEKMKTVGGNYMRGRCYSLHHRSKKIIQYDLDMNFIREWSCSQEASDFLKISRQNITSVCREERNSAGKFKWKLKDAI